MQIRYIGREKENFLVKDNDMDLIPGKVYEVIEISPRPKGWYRIIDESGEDYMYPPELFEIIEE